MKEIIYRDRKVQVPQCVDEMGEELYMSCVRLYMNAVEWRLDIDTVRKKLLTLLLGLNSYVGYMSIEKQEEALRHLPLTDPFIKMSEGKFTMDVATTSNLTPSYSGQKDYLSEMTFGQFIDCDLYARMYAREGDPAMLDALRGALRIKKDSHGTVSYCAFIQYQAVMKELHTRPIYINGEDIDFTILFKPSPKASTKPDDRTGWTGVAMELAENGAFGTYYQVMEAKFWDVMLFLYRKKYEKLHEKK